MNQNETFIKIITILIRMNIRGYTNKQYKAQVRINQKTNVTLEQIISLILNNNFQNLSFQF